MPWKQGYTTSDERTIADGMIEWPDGARCCVIVVVDLSLARQREGVTERDVRGDRGVFGLDAGLEAVVGLLARLSLRAVFPVPAVMVAHFGSRLAELEAAGHEVAVHGLRHEDVSELSRHDEAERMAIAIDLVGSAIGRQPDGWYSLPRASDPFAVGTVSDHTLDLLSATGLTYFGNGLADDAPYYWVVDAETRKVVPTLPYYYHFDDQFFLMYPRRGTGLEHADSLVENWRSEFTAQRARGRCFSMVVHPHAIAWCSRMAMLEGFLTEVAAHADVWNPTGAECIRYWTSRYPAESTLRLEPSIWQDHPGSLS
jgi:peptidoglycan/xylan/chitin deacetylase (PgdA/CDA1 family)